jgi:hypothetical protein
MVALFFRERIDISVQSPRLLAGCLRPSWTVKHGVPNSAFRRRKKAAAAEHGFA